MEPRRRPPATARWFAAAAMALAGCAAPAQPLGGPGGASRQAWAAAAALSRGVAVAWPAEAGRADAPAPVPCGLLAQAGFHAVRLAVPLPAIEALAIDGPAPQPPRPPAWQKLDSAIDGCLASGLTVVLGLRHPARGDPAAGPPPTEAQASRAFTAAWRRLASRYADRPPRLLFEIAFAAGAGTASKNASAAEVLAHAIRPGNPDRVVVLTWSDPIGLPQLRLPGDRHLIVGVANDEPYRFTRQSAPGVPHSRQWGGTGCCTLQERRLMVLPLEAAKTWSNEHRHPVWLAEFMSHKDIAPALRARHARLMRETAEERGIPWAYGDFSGDFGAYDPAARGWRPVLLQALTGP